METITPSLTKTSLLADLQTYDVGDNGITFNSDDALASLAAKTLATGTAELLTTPNSDSYGSALAIPIYRESKIINVVVMTIQPKSIGAGVFEIWEPVAPYDEVKLRSGYYAHLERFSNVSSFVRFERGSGLPGQVWDSKQAVIHDDLPSHLGFLRAAGASAGLLQTAVGIPVMDNDELKSVAVLISSAATPIAKGYEVWNASENGFSLEGAAYQNLDPALQIQPGTHVDLHVGLPGLAAVHEGATTTENQAILMAGRQSEAEQKQTEGTDGLIAGLAVPAYHGGKLTSVMTLLF